MFPSTWWWWYEMELKKKKNHITISHTWIHLVAIGLPLALSWKNSVVGLTFSEPAARPAGRLPVLMINFLLKWERNFKFSCCWCCRTTSSLSPNKVWNFFCKLTQASNKVLVSGTCLAFLSILCYESQTWTLTAKQKINMVTTETTYVLSGLC